MERGDYMVCTGIELFGVCPSCRSDARLGRLVRGMAWGITPYHMITARHLLGERSKWFVHEENEFGIRSLAGEGDTPEAALEAAGVDEGE
jgi:hypothetical protein